MFHALFLFNSSCCASSPPTRIQTRLIHYDKGNFVADAPLSSFIRHVVNTLGAEMLIIVFDYRMLFYCIRFLT